MLAPIAESAGRGRALRAPSRTIFGGCESSGDRSASSGWGDKSRLDRGLRLARSWIGRTGLSPREKRQTGRNEDFMAGMPWTPGRLRVVLARLQLQKAGRRSSGEHRSWRSFGEDSSEAARTLKSRVLYLEECERKTQREEGKKRSIGGFPSRGMFSGKLLRHEPVLG